MKTKQALVLYVPVIHEGYRALLEKYVGRADTVFVLGQQFIDELSPRREIRALNPKIACRLIRALGLFRKVRLLDRQSLTSLTGDRVITLTDVLCRKFAATYLDEEQVQFDTCFLRWDERSVAVQRSIAPDRVSRSKEEQSLMKRAKEAAQSASDWWRRVGAVLVSKREVCFEAYNQHLPDEHAPYLAGDPRDFIPAGERSEQSSAIHAEQQVVAWAARTGFALEGCDLYVTVFPCPACAKLVACAGLKRCFVGGGHASLDGRDVLREAGVEVVLVPLKTE